MFRLISKGNISYYIIDSFEKTGLVRHLFSTRKGGVSKNEYESMNLRINCDDKKENILKNFQIICDAIGVKSENLVFSNQVHDDKIYVVTKEDMGCGLTRPCKFDNCDGLICAQSGVPIITFFADCVPLYFLDPVKKVIALAHSGWKGTVKNIAAKTADKMCEEFGCRKEDMLVAIGPSIGECHFEVGDEVAEIFKNTNGGVVKKYGEKYHVNLQKTIENQFISCGIKKENITTANICTYCNSELLFSHRKTNGKRGTMAAVMELK